MLTPITTILNKWDFRNSHVDPDITGMAGEGGAFLSAESAVVCATDRRDPFATDRSPIPIGVAQRFALTQSKQVNDLDEIGSRIPFLIPGKTRTQAGITRLLIDGISLMKSVSLWSERFAKDGEDPKIWEPGKPYAADPGFDFTKTDFNTSTVDSYFFINLASDFFNRPLGLALFLYDNNGDIYGGVHLEDCIIRDHQLTFTATNTVIAENVTIAVKRVNAIST